MNWLSLTPIEVAGLWAAGAAVAVWLYLRARAPVHRRVSSLYFWSSVPEITQQSRRRIRDPWALLAQLIFLLLLILALANLRLGTPSESRKVAIVLDNSIWALQTVPGGVSMDSIRAEALRLVNSLPPNDPILLISAEPGAPPILPFTSDHARVRGAISAAKADVDVADITRALRTGQAALAGSGNGLLVYIGPGMVDGQAAHDFDQFRTEVESPGATDPRPQFLLRLVGDTGPVDNHGITRLSIARDEAQPDRWHLLTQIKNYDGKPANVTLSLSVNGKSFVTQPITLSPDELANVKSEFVWAPGGTLQAEISPSDALDADNRAIISIPGFHQMHAAVFTTDAVFAGEMHGALDSNPYLQAEFVAKDASPKVKPDIAIYQGVSVPDKPEFNSIWFLSGSAPKNSMPLRVTDWNMGHPVTRWVRTHDVSVRNPAALSVLPGDTVLAYQGTPPTPLIVARVQNGHRLVLIGFNPHDSNLPQQSAFPLLIAGGMEWLAGSLDEFPGSLSMGEIDLPGPVSRIYAPSGKEVTFARNGEFVHLLANEAGLYRVLTPGGEADVAVNPSLLPTQRLGVTPLEAAAPAAEPPPQNGLDFWRWLLFLAPIPLWLEWWLYYSSRRKKQWAADRESSSESGMENRDPISGRVREQNQARDASLASR